MSPPVFLFRKTHTFLCICYQFLISCFDVCVMMMDEASLLEDEEELLLLLLLQKRQRKPRKRRFWIRNIFLQRETRGTFRTLFQELLQDKELFFRYHRMTPSRFEHLLSLVEDKITKEKTNFRDPICAEERLSITLRFLATG